MGRVNGGGGGGARGTGRRGEGEGRGERESNLFGSGGKTCFQILLSPFPFLPPPSEELRSLLILLLPSTFFSLEVSESGYGGEEEDFVSRGLGKGFLLFLLVITVSTLLGLRNLDYLLIHSHTGFD